MRIKEDFLSFLWQNGFFIQNSLKTVRGEDIEILFPGYRNDSSGPDFLESKIRIEDKIWVGNVELHVKSSDWYAHGHETDNNYDSVVLHVVYEYDMPVFNSKNVQIPTLELKNKIPAKILDNFLQLSKAKSSIKCAAFLPVDRLVWEKWLERLFVERLEEKQHYFFKLLDRTVNDWEAVLYHALLRYFGMLHNTDAFEQMAERLPFSVFKKYVAEEKYTEALLLGTAGLFEDKDFLGDYMSELKKNYLFLKAKHQLRSIPSRIKFGGMRPVNFPTIRLSQFARLYKKNEMLFDKLILNENIHSIRKILRVSTSSYWENHYIPERETVRRKKVLGRAFTEGLIINVIVPLKFAYAQYSQNEVLQEKTLNLAQKLAPENNKVVRYFEKYGIKANNASDSQAMIRLQKNYCFQDNCINCAIGKTILSHE